MSAHGARSNMSATVKSTGMITFHYIFGVGAHMNQIFKAFIFRK